MKGIIVSTVVAVVVCVAVAAQGGEAVRAAGTAAEVKGKVDAVTVYRGQALVTRLVKVTGPAGLREIVVTDLPDRVLPGSIYAESADGVEVRSVRYRVRPVSEDIREEVRALDAQIRDVQDKLQANQRHTEVTRTNRAYLEKLEQFTAPTVTTELSKGVLNAETVETLTKFQFAQRLALADEEQKLAIEQRTLNEQLDLLQRQRQTLTAGTAETQREAVVFVNVARAEGGQLRVRYLVDQATWSPSYNMRTDGERKQVTVEYNASIQQMSGEDWTDVAMTLSTATPSLVAKAPVLAPLDIALAPASAQQVEGRADKEQAEKAYAMAKDKFIEQKKAAESQRAQGTVGRFSSLEDLSSQVAVLPDEGVSVTYQLPGRTSLPSRSDRQLIQVASLPMKAEFYKIAIPILTSYVYEEASATNDSAVTLLAGPASAYVAEQFVGHGEIPTVTVGESFTVGFGIDSSLRAAQEMTEKTEVVQGGNRVAELNYRVSIENFGAAPATVRVLDRLPSAKGTDIKITLVSPEGELSQDPAYLQTDRKKGFLRWDVQVPAQAIGPAAFAINYKFRLEYDKMMTVVVPQVITEYSRPGARSVDELLNEAAGNVRALELRH